MIEGKIIQPLTIDVKAFQKRYNSMVGLSSFERANKTALENKRMKWAAYRPLATEQLIDKVDENSYSTIVTPLASRSPKRSSVNGVLYGQTTTLSRPTEILAIFHALGVFKFDSEDPVIRQDPNRIVWWCISCKSFKPLTEFAHDKHNVHGLAFACNRCRKANERYIWKKAS